jgi:hypothetical protein
MVVTDLHGDWDAYRRYRDRFLSLMAEGQADFLVFAGDLIHSEGPEESDGSLPIVLDVIRLQGELPRQVIYPLGNHELPHIYGILLQRGSHVYTPRFEAALGDSRDAVAGFFEGLPFYLRSQAGVSICHAGATAEMVPAEATQRVFALSHRQILRDAAEALPDEEDHRAQLREAYGDSAGEPYESLAGRLLAVSGPEDPRYDGLLIGSLATAHPLFDLLWSALFTANELEEGSLYGESVAALLRHLSVGYARQEVLVTGHIGCRGGYRRVGERQLRLASAAHARPREAGRYLLFDAARRVTRDDLAAYLGSVFE